MSENERPRDSEFGRGPGANPLGSHPLIGGDLIFYVAIEATKWVWNESPSKGYARLVLLAIAAHCNSDGWAWPSLKTLEEAANTTRPTVLQSLEQLERDAEIVIERGGSGPGSVNRYFLFGFMSRVKKSKEEAGERVNRIVLPETTQTKTVDRLREGFEVNQETQNKNILEQEEEVLFSSKQEDSKEVYKTMKRYYRKALGKSPGNVPPSRGDEFLALVEKKTGDVLLAAFQLWVDENKDWLKKVKWPMAVFMKDANMHIEAYEDKIAGEQEQEDEEQFPQVKVPD